MNLNLEGVAGTVTPVPGSASDTFATAFFTNIESKIGGWLANAGNGVGNLFANQVHTKEICVAKSDGTEFCATGDQLAAMAQNSSGSGNNGGNSGGSTPDTTPPVITLTGDATMNLNVGDTYTEPGATATDNVDTNVNVVITGSVDTTTAGTYTIHYNATDTAGNHAVEVLRTVIVQ